MTAHKEIKITDKPLFDSYNAGMNMSFYNFSNIFMWRDVMNYRYSVIDGALCVCAEYRDQEPFMLFPLGVKNLKSTMKKIAERNGFPFTIRPLNQHMAEQISSLYPNIQLEYRRDLSDYIYNTSDLATLSGKKLHKKRNRLNKFIKAYQYEYVTITPDNVDFLKSAVDYLYTDEEKQNDDFVDENRAINELVNNFASLNLKAGVLTVDGAIIAYSIGEMQNHDTALIHTEKANREYDGAYSAINYEFVRHEFAETSFINREEDMGIEGLRQAKMAYNPIAFNNVYSITIKTKEDLNYVKSSNVKQMACTCGRVCK